MRRCARTLTDRPRDVLEPQPAGVLGQGRDLRPPQWVREVRLDCDGDALLVPVDQEGPACHTGARTCFDADMCWGSSQNLQAEPGHDWRSAA